MQMSKFDMCASICPKYAYWMEALRVPIWEANYESHRSRAQMVQSIW